MQLLVGFAVLQTLLLLQLHGCQGTNDIILSDVQVENNDDTPIQENLLGDTEPFIPTHEWQVVKPNQAIPAGLHVRMNFQTGIKEAKILEDDESKLQVNSNEESTGPKIVLGEEIKKDVNQFSENEDKIYFTKQHLKEALSEFRDKVGTKDVDDVTWSTDAKKAMEEEIANAERVKKKFRSIEEIKAELEDSMKMKMKPDVDVMKEILHYIMAKNSTVKEIGAALDNLEYYVHQFDNALDLDKIGGLEAVVQLLNHTNEDVSAKAANVIGAASQNNKEIELAVLHYGGLRLLLQMLQKEKKALTKKKSIFALSAIVRQNPNALADFIKLNGVANTLNVIQDKSLATSLHVKAIDFLFDLVEEQNLIIRKAKESNKTAVEEQPLLLNILVKSGLCDILFPILNTEDFYTKEKIMHAIKLSVDACKHTFKQQENVKVLEKELLVLMQKIKEEDDADFKEYLVNLKVQLEKDIIKKLKN